MLFQLIANDVVAHSVLFGGMALLLAISSYIALQIRKIFAIFAPLARIRDAMRVPAEAT